MKIAEWLDDFLRQNFVARATQRQDKTQKIAQQEKRTARQARELEALKRSVIAQRKAREPDV